MNILLKQVLIADPNSPFNHQQVDILIENNLIKQIGSLHDASAEIVINEPDLIVSPGWVDVFANFCEPGFEYKETLETGSSCAAAGGFTRVFALPNTKPVIDNKSMIEYVALKSGGLPIFIHPMGAISQKTGGNTLAEMYDMRNSGAVAFTDGIHPVQSSGLFLKALQYVKAFNGVLIQVPIDQSIGASGLMNEGIVSTQLGLPGIPAISEESMLKRDIDLVRYTDSKLHFTGISSSQSLQLIKDAKTEGLSVTCSVTPYHLFFCDEDLHDYNTYLKVNPPLRTRKDMLALREGIIDGTIDCIASHHFPQDWDHKVCEFEYAAFGMTGLQTAFSAVNHLMKDLSNDRLIDLFSNNARNIFGLPSSIIKEGNNAELTIFNKTATALFNNKSKSSNSAFAKITLQGLVKGIVNKGNIYL
jgi:dihydroorotase